MTSNSDVSTRRRVKLYMLNEDRQWDDKGTGHVSATFVEANSMALVVISETDGSHLLESKIQHDTAYQKQQETLIVWSEGDNMDLALSFQEKIGCDDIWEKICNVQGKDPSIEITQDLIDDTDEGDDLDMESTGSVTVGNNSNNNQGFEFPICDLNHLLEISEMFTQVINYPIQRERLATALERSQYLKQLVDLFHKAEALEDEKSLHHLYEIMRAIIQFNRRNLYELIFSEEMIMDTIGILEYNPSKRVRHREWLLRRTTFHEVIPMSSVLKAKITQTYRVQYIQDSCMPPPSLFDDNAGSSLNSFVYLNKIDIITKLQDDTQFVISLFQGLASRDTSQTTRRDLLLLLKEFCIIVNSFQPPQKELFFQFLCVNRAIKSLFYSFRVADESMKPICVDIIQIFIENQASVVRDFIMSESRDHDNRESSNSICPPPPSNSSAVQIIRHGGGDGSHNPGEFLNLMIDHLINDLDPELSNGFIITNIIKILIDPENMINSNQKNEKQEFLNFFYKNNISHLTRPLIDLTSDDQLKYDDYHTAMVMHNVLELLAFCVEFHAYNMKNYAFHNNILIRVLTLFKSQHKFVVLAALRVIRKFVASKEEFNYRYIIKNNMLSRVVALLDANRTYNMLNSAILELFEFIRTDNVICLITNVIENHWESSLRHHNYTKTFQLLKQRYDSHHHQTSITTGTGTAALVVVERPQALNMVGAKSSVANVTGTMGGVSGTIGSGTVSAGSTVNIVSSSSSILSGGNTNSSLSSSLVHNNLSQNRFGKESRTILDDDEEQWYDQDDEDEDDVHSSLIATTTTGASLVAANSSVTASTMTNSVGGFQHLHLHQQNHQTGGGSISVPATVSPVFIDRSSLLHSTMSNVVPGADAGISSSTTNTTIVSISGSGSSTAGVPFKLITSSSRYGGRDHHNHHHRSSHSQNPQHQQQPHHIQNTQQHIPINVKTTGLGLGLGSLADINMPESEVAIFVEAVAAVAAAAASTKAMGYKFENGSSSSVNYGTIDANNDFYMSSSNRSIANGQLKPPLGSKCQESNKMAIDSVSIGNSSEKKVPYLSPYLQTGLVDYSSDDDEEEEEDEEDDEGGGQQEGDSSDMMVVTPQRNKDNSGNSDNSSVSCAKKMKID